MEQDLAMPSQLQQRIKAFTLNEIKYKIKILKKRAPGTDILLPEG